MMLLPDLKENVCQVFVRETANSSKSINSALLGENFDAS